MPSNDNPPSGSNALEPEQRAVFDLLRRGRSYEEAATALSVDSAAVRARVLGACDTLVDPNGVAAERRQIIVDFLLDELPDSSAAGVARRLEEPAAEREYALRVRAALTRWFGDSLTEVPNPPEASSPPPAGGPGSAPSLADDPVEAAPSRRRSWPSRRMLAALAGAALVAAAVAVGVIALTGGSHHTTPTASTTTAKAVKQLARLPLTSPDRTSKAVGLGEIVQQGSVKGIILAAANVPANSTKPRDAYALWLYNSPNDVRLVGWVRKAVGKDGRLSTEGLLPGDAAKYHYVMLSLETNAKPTAPTKIILGGKLTGL